jgi:cell cycle sensor histidine kinase DivJ
MALVPIFLLARGAPSNWDVLAFTFLLAPICGVYVLHRTGRIEFAQAICVGAAVLLGVTLALANGSLTVASVACFLLAPLEAVLGGSVGLAMGGAAISLASITILTAFAGVGLIPRGGFGGPAADLAIVAAAVIYASLLSVRSIRNSEHRDARAERSMASYRELTDTVGDMVMQLDYSGAVVDVVTDPSNNFRCAPSDIAGRSLFERILVSDRPIFLKTVADAAQANAVVAAEFRLRVGSSRQDREDAPVFLWVEMRAHRSRALSGIVLAVLRDVTPMREARDAIEAAREASEQAAIWKDRFLANVSHELRTPLNAIIGFSEMLGNPALAPKDPERSREYANIINASGLHLLSMVNTILDMSKIETGNFEIEPEPFNLPGLIDSCCDMVVLKAKEKRIELSRAGAPQLQEIVADKRACKQIVLNLLSNAVKFTPEGGAVAITARIDGMFAEITVTDTGIGVTPKELARLGDPFFQAKSTYDRPYEGTGLGLSIVRGLVALHGGVMSFESAPNEGARVTVRLPLDCRDAAKANARTAKIQTLARRSIRPGAQEQARLNDQVKKIA